jgi:aspartate-semialdehyde dehydrogenase
MSYKVAVIGATGNVGREMLNTLAERNFPVKEVVALASRDSLGKEISFGDTETLKVQALENYDFKGTDIALFSAGSERSRVYAPIAAEKGCVVIDNSSYFRTRDDVPLIVPEVNLDELKNYTKTNIIANPNCSTIQRVVALKPLDDLAIIKRVVSSTYQSVSGAGKEAMDELYNQTKGIFVFQAAEPNKFPKQISFNVIPQCDSFLDNGYTFEEIKQMNETKKILGQDIAITVTSVRVPVFVGHSESINIEFENEISVEEAMEALSNFAGITVIDRKEEGGYITPIECVGEDAVFVSRIRKDPTIKNGLNMWVVSDNLRKGAALNAVQIAEELIKSYI